MSERGLFTVNPAEQGSDHKGKYYLGTLVITLSITAGKKYIHMCVNELGDYDRAEEALKRD